MEDFDTSKDLRKHRVLELDNNKVHIRCTDPYGHWYINLDKGQLPDKLKGAYTMYEYAERDVLAYLNEKGKEVKQVVK